MLIHESKKILIYQYQVGQLLTNCYFAVAPTTKETIIIDPGDEGDFLSEEIIRLGLQPSKILLTHGHFDHIGGLLPLKLNFDLQIYLPQPDQKIYAQASKSAEFWQDLIIDPPPKVDISFSTPLGLNLATAKFISLFTPGHTPGSTCFYFPQEKIIFTGDTLFADGVGRTDFSYSTPHDMKKSLTQLLKLPPNTIIFPGHGDPASIKQIPPSWANL